ncbi:hypothetical protein BV133_3051 [Blastochloris viridis]|uniref:Uncharacterized protein n=1 Tax=Blastochloris viridis TaxID=1079 RepID=A0A182D5F7_BLAVI|nr:hypothetical protein BV133_3051 [Blastochloris viridis]
MRNNWDSRPDIVTMATAGNAAKPERIEAAMRTADILD